MALIIILMFDFFWNEFLRSIGIIFGSGVSFWPLLSLWKVDSPAKILSSFLFLFIGGLLSVWMVLTVFNGLIDLLLNLLYYPYLVITVRLSWKGDSLLESSSWYPFFLAFFCVLFFFSWIDLLRLSLLSLSLLGVFLLGIKTLLYAFWGYCLELLEIYDRLIFFLLLFSILYCLFRYSYSIFFFFSYSKF